jgi:GTP diphosphokinase / guanosine-3',5'-bis(diphosphate) 3'-diphosphatase
MRLNDLINKVEIYAQNADIQTIVKAYLFAAQAHNGQTRKSGEAYLTHPLAVATILSEMKMDVDTIATGLLHDTMEDCMTTYEELKNEFSEDVAELVDGVTKMGKLQFRSKEEAQAENFRKMVLAMSKDIRVVLVKLADRLHNMRTMQHMKSDRQVAISRETLDIFAPIANRLGLSRIKSELEDLCFRYLEPEIYT